MKKVIKVLKEIVGRTSFVVMLTLLYVAIFIGSLIFGVIPSTMWVVKSLKKYFDA